MVTRNVSRLAKLGAPRWVRGLGVATLAVILVGNLAFITLSWFSRGGPRVYAALVFLWILGLVALVFLLRLWRVTVSVRR